MEDYAIIIDGIKKYYDKNNFKKRLSNLLKLKGLSSDKLLALDQINLKVKKGEIFGLLGLNGAGKSTLIKILTTILSPDEGTVYVEGLNAIKESLKVRQKIGVLYEDSDRGFGWRLNTMTNLIFYAREYMINEPKKKVEEILKIVELDEDALSKSFQKLSKGQKQKVGLSRALIPDPEVLILDEPQRSLDILFIMRLKDLIRRKFGKEERTIFLSTHDMHLVEETCDRIAIINKGKIIKIGRIDEFKSIFETINTNSYLLEFLIKPWENIVKMVEKLKEIVDVEDIKIINQTKIKIIIKKQKIDSLNLVIQAVIDEKFIITSITRETVPLEENIAKILRGDKN